MNWATAVVIIVAVSALVAVLKARYRAQAGIVSDKQGNETYIAQSDGEAQREVEELRERVKVLERIAYDSNNSSARERDAIAKEIEQLRDK